MSKEKDSKTKALGTAYKHRRKMILGVALVLAVLIGVDGAAAGGTGLGGGGL